jgi:type IV pilus assembly protein PilY1
MLFQRLKKPLVYFLIFCTQVAPLNAAWAQTIAAVPPNISSNSAKPMMTLAVSKEHTLFGPIYTDFEDIDGDGVIDFTFIPTFKYYGYFDSKKCYSYSTADNRFNPEDATTGTNFACQTSDDSKRWWSGNFLNWSTMTRIDVMRKMLYGGKRSTDSTSVTVLERANLSKDGHSFVKFYTGTDIRSYTPFKVSDLAKTTGVNSANATSGTTGYAGLTICNRSDANNSGGNPVIRLVKGNYRLWSTIGGSVCEWGSGSTDTATTWNSGSSFNPKLSRYYGNAQTWYGGSAYLHERYFPSIAADGANPPLLGIASAELTVRVRACVTGKIGDERCTNYATGNVAKPTGLLQEFGMPPLTGTTPGLTAKAEFGLITGGYDQNLDAGVLRKNMGDFADEILPTTGQFCHSASVTCPTGTAPLDDGRVTGKGAIAALDRIILYGAGGYGGGSGLLGSTITNGTTPAWGNPMGEMIVQALRYYAQAASTNPTTTTNDATLSLPVVGASTWPAWRDPLSNTNTQRKARYGDSTCRPLTVLAMSSSAIGFDGNVAPTDFATLANRGGKTLADFTNLIGGAEGVAGVRSVGSVTGGFGNNCTAKTVALFSDVTGVCPDAPGLGGTYLSSGAALYANTNRVRNFGSGTNELPGVAPPDLPSTALKVKTYAASLAGGSARIDVKVPGTNRYVYITPEGLWDRGSAIPGGMLTFNSISTSSTHGAFVVTWNDQLFGGDYDMDIVGYLRYDIVLNAGKYYIDITTDILGVNAGALGAHGFSIIGTNPAPDATYYLSREDKRYLTHGHKTAAGNAVMAPTAQSDFLCGNATYRGLAPTQACDVSSGDNVARDVDLQKTLRFEMLGVTSALLNDPLWYVAKYGSFETAGVTTVSGTQTLPLTSWDAKRADGQPCGGSTGLSCSDGIPDGYFLARRPELLEQQLRDQLEQIVASSNSAPAVSSSQLIDGSYKYVAQFDPTLKKGSITAYLLGASGDFSSTPAWDAGELLKQLPLSSRQVITNSDVLTGIPFQWTSLNATYTTALKGTTTASFNARAEKLVEYMRGAVTNEEPLGEKFQARSISNLMGTVVNSTPWVQNRPSALFLDYMFPSTTASYASFASSNSNRDKMLWVGANDGMLHGFKADTGAPVISYVPGLLAPKLKDLATTSTSITAGMDGSPFTGDVVITQPSGTSTWSTYLFSSLGRGGKGMFALDVTNTGKSTTPTVATLLTESNAADIFKWEFSSTDDSDLGYVLGDPLTSQFSGQATPIVRLNNGKFAILAPNGPGSTAGKAKLFIIGAAGPGTDNMWNASSDYYKLETLAVDSGNGLMGANWIDIDNNGTVDFVYASDLKGNIWKFDLQSANPADWGSAFKTSGLNTPFYSAKSSSGSALPISTAPAFGFPSQGGVVVAFGTGKALDSTDFPGSSTNRMFGVYDRTGTTGTATFSLPTGTSTLVQRTLTELSSGTVTLSVTTPVDLSTKDGWYFDFPGSGEALLATPDERSKNIAFTTVRSANTSVDQCFYTPPGRFYLMDPVTGLPAGKTLGSYVDPITGVTIYYIAIPSADQKVRVINDRSNRVSINCTAEPQRCFCLANPADAACNCAANPSDPNCKPAACSGNTFSYRVIGKTSDYNLCLRSFDARIQWREVPGLKTKPNSW